MWLHIGNLRLLQQKTHSLGCGVLSVFPILHYPSYLAPAVCSSLAEGTQLQDSEAGSESEASTGCLPGTLQGFFHWWPGLMLVIRIVRFIALTANTKHDPRLSVLFLGATGLPLALLSACGLYKSKILNFIKTALNSNLNLHFCHFSDIKVQPEYGLEKSTRPALAGSQL